MGTHHGPGGNPSSDWHPADIVAALHKKGWSLRKLSVHHGYAPTVLRQAVARRWPKGERLIAQAIGVEPGLIWPSRYPQGAKDNTLDEPGVNAARDAA